jgi:phosphatidylserine decarboxylase
MIGSAKSSVFRFISLNMWGVLPGVTQRGISRVYANVYNKKWSRHIIKPYCKNHYNDPEYLKLFKPASGADSYQTFQDFFTREYITLPKIESEFIWPCEGLLCDYGKVGELREIKIKGQKKHLRTVFGDKGHEIPNEYYYSNIFLHNNNYHRIHTPIDATISRIEHIEGELVLLRPWAYKDPSLPALRNERVNVDIVDKQGRTWYLSIVGGPAVASIVMAKGMKVGTKINIGQEIATFLLGSTFCMASPEPMRYSKVSDQVFLGDKY